METKEIKSKKGLGMTLTEAIGELEKGYYICNQDEPKDTFYLLYCFDAEVVLMSNNTRIPFHTFKEQAKTDKSVWYIYQPDKLKHPTQQARVELIEKQRLTIFEYDKEIQKQYLQIRDLTERNGNLTRITNDQTERIEVMQHELKNYEIAFERHCNDNDTALSESFNRNNTLCDHLEAAKESRERLASKFTNWFIFLAFIVSVELAVIVAMCLRAVNYNLPIF